MHECQILKSASLILYLMTKKHFHSDGLFSILCKFGPVMANKFFVVKVTPKIKKKKEI